jgi:hypothetical protein
MLLGLLEVLVAFFDPPAEETKVDVGDGHVTDFVGVNSDLVGCEVDVK